MTTIRIETIAGRRSALLLQDMFPICGKFLEPYFRSGHPVRIGDPDIVRSIERSANQVVGMIRAGVRFIKYQPDALRIERILLEEC